ncbi:MAG: aminotransferase [Clostridia bacterium]|nr:aminotransferase [Clostridia bacterium]
MKRFDSLSKNEREALYKELLETYNGYLKRGLSLDLSRGKPNSEQLDVSQELLSYPVTREDTVFAGTDCRNYGVLDGIPAAKALFADMLDLPVDHIFVGGNSSLQLMYDALSRAMLFGVVGSERPWCREEGLKWICVAPGYDRHFRITELLGFELLTVKMNSDGPDMDEVERLARDPKVKGIWCVPKYSNPTGNTYSDEVVRRLVSMECGAPDFRIMWDNAYAVHDITETTDPLLNVFEAAKDAGNEDRVFYFSSTSKITFPGAGVAIMAASPKNLKQMMPIIGAQTIGYDKINQIRHVKYLKDKETTARHMQELGALIGRKFEITLGAFEALEGLGIAEWTKPNGGYFVSLDLMPGCAKRVFGHMKDAGVTLTSVGATFPYGIDPEDRNLRIAPTYPTDAELSLACEILVVAVKIASLEKLM